ncbi:MAG: anti-sigma factor, partial [Candidatus Hydrogenedentes bacterium]|nr:anti-sigma factor [Candidatus Hydrogenedentota bacterium]
MALPCKQIQTEFSALLDDELDTEDRELVEEHLAECAECLRELHGFQQVTDAYRYHHPVKAPDDFEERLREALAPAPARHTLAWPVWKFAAAAVVLLGISLSLWRMTDRDGDMLQLTKNMPEVASEALTDATSSAPPRSLPVAAPEVANQGQSLNEMAVAGDADADGVIVDETLPMEEAEEERMAGGGGRIGASASDNPSSGAFGGGG